MPRKETISLIAVDLDGTLLTNAGAAAPEGGALIQEASRQGMYVVLATTRNPDSV
jgi:hydroxymethylpyrimidine pyrophosphatase-like HAD family hydrolase